MNDSVELTKTYPVHAGLGALVAFSDIRSTADLLSFGAGRINPSEERKITRVKEIFRG